MPWNVLKFGFNLIFVLGHFNKYPQTFLKFLTSTSRVYGSNFFATGVCFRLKSSAAFNNAGFFGFNFSPEFNLNLRKHTIFLATFSSSHLNINTFREEEKSFRVQQPFTFDRHRNASWFPARNFYALIFVCNLYDRQTFLCSWHLD